MRAVPLLLLALVWTGALASVEKETITLPGLYGVGSRPRCNWSKTTRKVLQPFQALWVVEDYNSYSLGNGRFMESAAFGPDDTDNKFFLRLYPNGMFSTFASDVALAILLKRPKSTLSQFTVSILDRAGEKKHSKRSETLLMSRDNSTVYTTIFKFIEKNSLSEDLLPDGRLTILIELEEEAILSDAHWTNELFTDKGPNISPNFTNPINSGEDNSVSFTRRAVV